MAGGGAFLVGTHDGDVVSSGAGFRGQGLNAIGKHAIVIADQKAKRANRGWGGRG
jgi:hypothetical protein